MECDECTKGFLFILLRLKVIKKGWMIDFETKDFLVCSNPFCDFESEAV